MNNILEFWGQKAKGQGYKVTKCAFLNSMSLLRELELTNFDIRPVYTEKL